MIYLGDITKISGYTAPSVEVIIGGSPCQDLSVAGKRAGLQGERSGLFMEQIRIIKEMRENDRRIRTDDHVRPRYMVWENVPGAFSSAKGEDFRAVLEETARIADENAVIHRSEGGKWTTAGCVMGDGWSIAWRVLDAQFWGVPQRRRRIALVADFGGNTAPEILFERESVSWDSPESGTAREGAAGDAENGVDTAICIQGNCIDRPAVYDARGNGNGQADIASHITEDVAQTLNCMHDQQAVMTYMSMQAIGEYRESDVASSCKQRDYKDATDLICVADCRNGTENPDINGTLQSKPNGGMSLNLQNVVREYSIVRRLTPLECERLQGYPDGWTDLGEWVDSKGKVHQTSDSARYKALGNSIALPPWRFVLGRMNVYLTEHTMASLFDGIGGFPLIWQELNGPGKCLWASEIEEFPIAVTKRRFEDD